MPEKQLGDMQIGERSVNFSDPGCRKTASACVYAYWL